MPSIPLLAKQKCFVTVLGYLIYLQKIEDTMFLNHMKNRKIYEFITYFKLEKWEMNNEHGIFNFLLLIVICTHELDPAEYFVGNIYLSNYSFAFFADTFL